MTIIEDRNIGSTPASVDRMTGIIYINPDVFYQLTPFQQKFVLQHELGHYNLQTTSEIEADAYAFDQLAGTEYRSLKQALGSISEVLSDENHTKQERYEALYYRALRWDAANGNEWAKSELEKYRSDYFSLEFGNKAKQEIAKGQADSMREQAETTKSIAKFQGTKSILNVVLAVALCGAVLYFFVIKK